MKRYKNLLIMMVLIAFPAAAVSETGAYNRLDPDALGKALEGMGMRELLIQMSEDTAGEADSFAQLRIKVRLKLLDYRKPGNKDKTKDLAEVTKIYESLIKKFSTVNQSAAFVDDWNEDVLAQWLSHCRDCLGHSYAVGYLQAKSLAERVQYLQGSEDDRKKLRMLMQKADRSIARVEEVLADIDGALRENFFLRMVTGEQVETITTNLALRASWSRFYYALSISPDTVNPSDKGLRVDKLDSAIRSGRVFTGDDYPSTRGSVLLLTGMCHRELGEHDKAATALKKANDDPKSKLGTRFQAMFEIARNSIEAGQSLSKQAMVLIDGGHAADGKAKLSEAVKRFAGVEAREVDAFAKVGQELYGKGKHRFDVVYTAMLRNYLYIQWAKALEKDNPEESQVMAGKAREIMIAAFDDLQNDPALLDYFAKILAGKFAGVTDVTNLNSMIVYSMALQAKGKKDWKLAEKLLKAVQGRDDPLSAKIADLVLWQLANMSFTQNDNLTSAKLFSQLAKKFPDSDKAFDSAQNACKIYSTIAGERGETLTADIRKQFIDALSVLLETNQKWANRAPQWWFDLGWHRSALADYQDQAGASELFAEALIAYQKVPQDSEQYLQARNEAVMIRVQMFDIAPADKLVELAKPLSDELTAYAKLAATEAKRFEDKDDPDKSDMLREWGAYADFHSVRIRVDVLKKADALAELENLPTKWAGTSILQRASQFRISKLVDAEQYDEATRALADFEKKYDSTKASDLKIRILSALRKQIELMKRRVALSAKVARTQQQKADLLIKQKALQKKRNICFTYSTALLKQMKASGADEKPLYYAKQSVAFAQYETGDSKGAINVYKELAAQDAAKRKIKADAISERLSPILKNIKQADGVIRRVKSSAKAMLKFVADDDVPPESLPSCLQLLNSLRALKRAEDKGEDLEQILAQISSDAQIAAEDYRKHLTGLLEIDVVNVLGIARCYAGMNNYDNALVEYNKLANGINRNHRPKLYWETWLEYFELQLKAFAENKTVMAKMAMSIRALRASDRSEGKTMGGLNREFTDLENNADKLTK